MTELTSKSKASVITFVIILTCLMLGFHYENVIRGIFPDYTFEATKAHNQCKPTGFREYVGTYHELK